MSNDNYWEDEDNQVQSDSNGKDAMANIRAAKRADEKRIKDLEEQLAAFTKQRDESIVSKVLESKGVNAKAARLVLKDLDAISEESVNNWLAENGDLIGFQPKQESAVNSADIQALKHQDDVTSTANSTPVYSDDIERAILNAKSEEEIMSIIKSLG